jgi:hypothetical protein
MCIRPGGSVGIVHRGGRVLLLLLLGAIAFGAFVAAIKGDDVGVRNALGNVSAPWVVVPFLAGTLCSRAWHAALIGIATTLAAFFGFYLAEAAILDLGPHPWYVDLKLTLGSGHLYEIWGTPVGLIYGLFGWLWASRSSAAALAAVGLAFVSEPLIVFALRRADLWGGGGLFGHAWLWATEVTIGLAVIAYALARAQPGPAKTS